jgi:hypothetical protein
LPTEEATINRVAAAVPRIAVAAVVFVLIIVSPASLAARRIARRENYLPPSAE